MQGRRLGYLWQSSKKGEEKKLPMLLPTVAKHATLYQNYAKGVKENLP
jgi:hypothetical protein